LSGNNYKILTDEQLKKMNTVEEISDHYKPQSYTPTREQAMRLTQAAVRSTQLWMEMRI